MATPVIFYDKDLPEIPGRLPFLAPDSYLRKIEATDGEYEIVDGRRPSDMLLISKLRAAVGQWRNAGYPAASEVSQRLLQYWFDEDHEVSGFPTPFRYWFCQREAIETLIYLIEIVGNRDAIHLIDDYAEVYRRGLLSESIAYHTTIEGQRRMTRHSLERDKISEQDLPPESLRRYAFKMATGSGKTWVMAMAIVWAYFHKRRVPGSDLSTNFLLVAPNVIVYQRLARDFANNRIFHELPLIPPEWRPWQQKVILRGESNEPDPSGNLFLTNIQQIYESREAEWTPLNAVDAVLGRKPVQDLTTHQRSMLDRLHDLKDLIVLNDEAHHVHDDELAWNQALLSLHGGLPNGLSLWLDFSATPKDQGGLYYPWTVCDYPLAQAVEDRIIKAPLIVTMEDNPRHPGTDPGHVTKADVVEKYGFWLHAAMQRWREHWDTYRQYGVRPVLFIMVERSVYADAVAQYLLDAREFGLRKSEVLTIHTNVKGDIRKGDLDKARHAARDIDKAGNRIKVIVSVMMLKEGWDVRNVSVVLGLRPFTAKAQILPEQVVGRGLRLMHDIGPDKTQTLEVLGTQNLLDLLRNQLEAEGVSVVTSRSAPTRAVKIEPVQERLAFDIVLPIPKPSLTHNVRKLGDLDPTTLDMLLDQNDVAESLRMRLRMDFFTTDTQVHQTDLATGPLPMAQELLSAITRKVMSQARLSRAFAALVPIVRAYIVNRCFGKPVDVDSELVRSHLQDPRLQDHIAKYLAAEIGKLTAEHRELEFEREDFRLSETRPFQWRRNLPPLECTKTIFNYVATYNTFERRFAEFLDQASDVLRFASLGTTEQGDTGTSFRVDYLKSSGAIGFYHPDWVVVQSTSEGEVNWIIETKGREFEDTDAKDAAIRLWCQRASAQTVQTWRYHRVNQSDFDRLQPQTLAGIVIATRSILAETI